MLPELVDRLGIVAVGTLGPGGVLYSAGAGIHARTRPDPAPTVFGYHEPLDLLVILAAALHSAVVAFWVSWWTAGCCRGRESGAVRLPRMPVAFTRRVYR